MSKYKHDLTRMVKGGSVSAVGGILTVFFRMLSGIFIAQLLGGPWRFGLYDLAEKIVFFLRDLTIPGTTYAVKRFLPMYDADGDRGSLKGLLLFLLKVTGTLSLVVFGLVAIFAPSIAGAFGKPGAAGYIRILSIVLPFFALTMIMLSCLTASHRVKYQVLVEKILVPGVRLLMLLAIVFLGSQALRYMAVAWSLPLASALGFVLALFFFLKTFDVLRDNTVVPKYHSGEVIKFSLPLAAGRPVGYLMHYISSFIVAFYLTGRDMGQYGIVTRLAPFLIIPLQSANLVFIPMISELDHLKKHDELERHFKFVAKWIFSFSFFIFLVFILLTKPVLSIFGHAYITARTQQCLILVCLAQLIRAGVGPVGMLLSMTGRPKLILYNAIALLIVNIILGLILIPLKGPFGGIVGAGICQGLAIAGVNILYLMQVRHYLKMHPFSLEYLKPLVAGLLSGIIVYGILHVTGQVEAWETFRPEGFFGYLSVLGHIALFTLILGAFFAFFTYLFGLGDDDKFILKQILIKFKRVRPGFIDKK